MKVIVVSAALLTLVAGRSDAGIFLRGNAGWLDVDAQERAGVGSPFLPGAGGSFELGFSLLRNVSLSGEFGPKYDLAVRNTDATDDVEDGSYRTMLGNLTFRMERIESVEPFLILGGGQAEMEYTYAGAGKPLQIGGVTQYIKVEKEKAWIGAFGMGFDAPISSWLLWGARGRYLLHRWRGIADDGRYLPFSGGNGYVLEWSLQLRF